jgi:hypothetical protein
VVPTVGSSVPTQHFNQHVTPTTINTTSSTGLSPRISVSTPRSQAPQHPPPGTQYIALYDYQQQRGEELSFASGDTLALVQWQGNEWNEMSVVASARGTPLEHKGQVPFNYVAKVLCTANVMFDYKIGNGDPMANQRLPLNRGEVVTVYEQQAGWWQGVVNGKMGSFPSNYVKANPLPSSQGSGNGHGHGNGMQTQDMSEQEWNQLSFKQRSQTMAPARQSNKPRGNSTISID